MGGDKKKDKDKQKDKQKTGVAARTRSQTRKAREEDKVFDENNQEMTLEELKEKYGLVDLDIAEESQKNYEDLAAELEGMRVTVEQSGALTEEVYALRNEARRAANLEDEVKALRSELARRNGGGRGGGTPVLVPGGGGYPQDYPPGLHVDAAKVPLPRVKSPDTIKKLVIGQVRKLISQWKAYSARFGGMMRIDISEFIDTNLWLKLQNEDENTFQAGNNEEILKYFQDYERDYKDERAEDAVSLAKKLKLSKNANRSKRQRVMKLLDQGAELYALVRDAPEEES